MRAYKIKVDQAHTAEDVEKSVDWAGTQADAKKAKREMAEAHGLGPLSKYVTIDEVDVPTDKQGLLQFLKDNVKE